MTKLTFATSLLCLTAAVAAVSTGCASSADSIGATTEALASDGGSQGSLLISQVFGGGAASANHLNQDFVELFNPTTKAITLDGLSLQIADASSDFGSPIALTGSVPAGGFYLVGLHKDTAAGGIDLPTPDSNNASGPDLGTVSGKVILATTTNALSCGGVTSCKATPGVYLDMVGYGATSDQEGTLKVGGLDGGTAAFRKGNGCTDTNNNGNDFLVQAPSPRNSATAVALCPTTKDAGSDAAKPVGVTDPDLSDDPGDVDSGTSKGSSSTSGAAAGDDSGCSVGVAGVGNLSAMGLLVAAGLAVGVRRRPRRRQS